MSFQATPRQTAQVSAFGTSAPGVFPSGTLAGSLIVVAFTNQLASGDATSVTDDKGNTYAKGIVTAVATQRHEEIWYCLSAVAGVITVTVSDGATSANIAGSVSEWTGGASGVRASAAAANASTVTSPSSPLAVQPGDLVIGALGYQAAVSGTRQDTLQSGSTLLFAVTRTTTMQSSAYVIAVSAGSLGPSWAMSPGVATGTASIAFISASTNVAPAANAGPDQTVEPWVTVTLDGSGSSDPDGTIASYAWSQSSGTAVALSGTGATRTFSSPAALADQALVFSLTVTDNSGGTNTDTVSITVKAATEAFASTGGWVAMQNQKL